VYFTYAGQFLHKEASVDLENNFLKVNSRVMRFEKLPAWDFLNSDDGCLHVKPESGYQAEGIIEGKYTDYIMDSLYSTDFEYSEFSV